VCPRIGGRRDRASSPRTSLGASERSEAICPRFSTARRIELGDPLRMVARQSTLRYFRAKPESTTTAGTANPTGLPKRDSEAALGYTS
jgi:hypothetical protein